MKIFSVSQIKEWEQHTIENEPISSIDLMERASQTFTSWFMQTFGESDETVHVFCGTGNNGGDGLAVARMLHATFYNVQVYLCNFSEERSKDNATNLKRLKKVRGIEILEIKDGDWQPEFHKNDIVIDAVFGSGLNKALAGDWKDLIKKLNQHEGEKVAIDMPSGLFADKNTRGTTFEATHTFSFQTPKMAFFFPENQDNVGDWVYAGIELSEAFSKKEKSNNYLITPELVQPFLKARKKFDHKGTYGHALLIAGSFGKIGATILASKAALRAGCGLLTAHVPRCGYEVMQMSVPEAMLSVDWQKYYFAEAPDLSKYEAVGIGCGIGTSVHTCRAFEELLDKFQQPLLLDADALNILSQHPEMLAKIPKGSIFTPHPKEFERLFGETSNSFERNKLQRKKAKELGVYIILKGANTCIATPKGDCFFNNTGNPGMGTAGSGDVLSGMITSFLAQGYDPLDASLLGVYLHGLAGDIAVEETEQESLLASDIINHLGMAFHDLKNWEPIDEMEPF